MLHGTTVLLAGPVTELTQALAAGLAAAGATVRLPTVDSREADSHVSAMSAELGRIDVLVNSITLAPSIAFFDMSRGSWDRLLSVALGDAFLWSQAVSQTMSLAGAQGAIINLAIEADTQGDEACFARLVRREGVVAFTKALAAELADRQIRVNAIVGAQPFEEVIQATRFLCAVQGAFVTGQTLDLALRHQGY